MPIKFFGQLAIPGGALAVTFIGTLDVILKFCQIGLALGAIIFTLFQIWKIRLEIYEKIRARRKSDTVHIAKLPSPPR